ncbi:hypothetical protein FIBSPDRAFT_936394 [Athelia psychrophila]|uniref:Uncharacterized protein n=1 Tax=Athelia psychrophila TaxID=1759441 RepID=A0A166C6L6_9AGAM|nr:hypothetical protein FIBSPDRAFT_936394 [Fibularhizoctonia sp. CBS 109695]
MLVDCAIADEAGLLRGQKHKPEADKIFVEPPGAVQPAPINPAQIAALKQAIWRSSVVLRSPPYAVIGTPEIASNAYGLMALMDNAVTVVDWQNKFNRFINVDGDDIHCNCNAQNSVARAGDEPFFSERRKIYQPCPSTDSHPKLKGRRPTLRQLQYALTFQVALGTAGLIGRVLAAHQRP